MVVLTAVVATAYLALSLRSPAPGRVELAGFSADSTATVGLAGVFPPAGEPALRNPLGIVTDGERLWVAESDAGIVSVFDAHGGRLGSLVIPTVERVHTAYPSVLALAGDRLAVVDNASGRVIVVDAEPPAGDETAEVLVVLGERGEAPERPTAVAYGDGEYLVADAGDRTIKVYGENGEHVRTVVPALDPASTYPGGLALADGRLYVVDSNAGRVVVLDPSSGEQVGVFADRFTLPRAIASGPDGALAVSDAFARAVHLSDASGARYDTIDESTVPQAPLSSPRGVAWLAGDGRVYVTDATLGHVVVFNVRAR